MPMVAFPTFYYSSKEADKYVRSFSQKYLNDLNDFELDNFETLYQ